ncbi:MAG: alpha-D-ribose 1-methylphosphonate 5-triphosphate diphosphatase, partial [Pseudomonadota bacterium]
MQFSTTWGQATRSTALCAIRGGRVLTPEGLIEADLLIADGRIAAIGGALPEDAAVLPAEGRLVLPGIVDIHGDAFERQVMPRPGTLFPLAIALAETDRQLVANGITTAFHGVTLSWEPGLRSPESAQAIVAALDALAPRLLADNRLHIRWETFALEAMDLVEGWLTRRPAPILAFNDHTTNRMAGGHTARQAARDAQRAGISEAEYTALCDAVWARRDEVPGAIQHLAQAAREAGAVLLAHDERSPAERSHFRALGAVTSEFPLTRDTAAAARAEGEHTVLGAPNVVRGGSHIGMLDAQPAVAEGLCTILASDYYYPAPLAAAFRLWREGS